MKTIAQQLNVKDFPFEIRDKEGRIIYIEDKDGKWTKREYDSRALISNNMIYCEDSTGLIKDNRPKDDIITIEGIKYKRINE